MIGIGIPLVLFFFQDDGILFTIHSVETVEKRKLNQEELKKVRKFIFDLWISGSSKDKGFSKEELDGVLKKPKEEREHILDKLIEEDVDKYIMNELILRAVYFFSQDMKIVETTTQKDIPIPYRKLVGVGILIALIGIGMFIFSFSPKDKPKKTEGDE